MDNYLLVEKYIKNDIADEIIRNCISCGNLIISKAASKNCHDLCNFMLSHYNIDNELKYIYCLYKKGKKQTIKCYQVSDGKLCWEKPSGGAVIVCNGFLVTNFPTGRYGKRVMDAKTGETLMDIDNKTTTSGRSPVGVKAMMTMVEHQKNVHLFIGVPNGYRLYRFLRDTKVVGGKAK